MFLSPSLNIFRTFRSLNCSLIFLTFFRTFGRFPCFCLCLFHSSSYFSLTFPYFLYHSLLFFIFLYFSLSFFKFLTHFSAVLISLLFFQFLPHFVIAFRAPVVVVPLHFSVFSTLSLLFFTFPYSSLSCFIFLYFSLRFFTFPYLSLLTFPFRTFRRFSVTFSSFQFLFASVFRSSFLSLLVTTFTMSLSFATYHYPWLPCYL